MPDLPRVIVPELAGCECPADCEVGLVNLHTPCPDRNCPEPSHLTGFAIAIVFATDGKRIARTFSTAQARELIASLQKQLALAESAELTLIAQGEGDA